MTNIISTNAKPRLCGCGQPVCKIYSEIISRWLYSTWCPECEEKQKLRDVRSDRQKRAEYIRQAIQNRLPKIYHEAHMRDINIRLREMFYRKPANQGLYIWGPVGTGKTYFSAAMVRCYLCQGKKVRFISLKDLLLDLRESFRTDKTERQILRPFLRADLLVLDDVGMIKTGGIESNFSQDTMQTIIDGRLQNDLPTVITSNLSPENLATAFGERIGSRLRTYLTIRLGGKDKRC